MKKFCATIMLAGAAFAGAGAMSASAGQPIGQPTEPKPVTCSSLVQCFNLSNACPSGTHDFDFEIGIGGVTGSCTKKLYV